MNTLKSRHNRFRRSLRTRVRHYEMTLCAERRRRPEKTRGLTADIVFTLQAWTRNTIMPSSGKPSGYLYIRRCQNSESPLVRAVPIIYCHEKHAYVSAAAVVVVQKRPSIVIVTDDFDEVLKSFFFF